MIWTRRDVLSMAIAGTTTGPLLLAGRRARAASPLEEALQKVAGARSGLTTLAGPFEQERTIGLLAAKVKSTGSLTMVRPDRLRWELAPPDAVVYWVTPAGFAFQNARGEKGRVPATHAKIAAALDDLKIVLGDRLDGLAERYSLTLEKSDGPLVSFSAEPRPGAAAGRLKRIEFDIDLAEGGSPRRVVLIDGPKDRTQIVFGKLVRNGAVDPERMKSP